MYNGVGHGGRYDGEFVHQRGYGMGVGSFQSGAGWGMLGKLVATAGKGAMKSVTRIGKAVGKTALKRARSVAIKGVRKVASQIRREAIKHGKKALTNAVKNKSLRQAAKKAAAAATNKAAEFAAQKALQIVQPKTGDSHTKAKVKRLIRQNINPTKIKKAVKRAAPKRVTPKKSKTKARRRGVVVSRFGARLKGRRTIYSKNK